MYKGQAISAAIIIGFGLFGIMVGSATGDTRAASIYFVFGILIAWICSVVIHSVPKQWKLMDYWLKPW